MKIPSAHTTSLTSVLIGILGLILMLERASSQSAEQSKEGKENQPMSSVQKKADKSTAVKQTFADFDAGVNRISLAGSVNDNSINISLMTGQRKTYSVVIHNPGDSPAEWEVSVRGEADVLYRLHRPGESAFACEKPDVADNTSADASLRSYEDDSTKRILSNSEAVHSAAKALSKGSSASDKIPPVPSLGRDDVLDDNRAEKASRDVSDGHLFTDAQVKSATMAERKDPIQELWQWYRYLDCGHSRFAPKVDIMEVSVDNGEHWRQILPVGDRPLVVNAKCLNPASFIEKYTLSGWEPDGYSVVFLDDLLADIRRLSASLSVQPRSGIVAQGGSMEIELTCDASALDSDNHAYDIILKTKGFTDTEIVVPVHITVVPDPESLNDPTFVTLKSGQPGIDQIPQEYSLHQNYPNPFNPSTVIRFDLPEESYVKITIYDLLGRALFSLVDEKMSAGRQGQLWEGRNSDGLHVASGVYFYRIEARSLVSQRSLTAVKKMLLMK